MRGRVVRRLVRSARRARRVTVVPFPRATRGGFFPPLLLPTRLESRSPPHRRRFRCQPARFPERRRGALGLFSEPCGGWPLETRCLLLLTRGRGRGPTAARQHATRRAARAGGDGWFGRASRAAREVAQGSSRLQQAVRGNTREIPWPSPRTSTRPCSIVGKVEETTVVVVLYCCDGLTVLLSSLTGLECVAGVPRRPGRRAARSRARDARGDRDASARARRGRRRRRRRRRCRRRRRHRRRRRPPHALSCRRGWMVVMAMARSSSRRGAARMLLWSVVRCGAVVPLVSVPRGRRGTPPRRPRRPPRAPPRACGTAAPSATARRRPPTRRGARPPRGHTHDVRAFRSEPTVGM